MSLPQAFRPVFVVGCQRSGSTMLGAMLGAHPDVICLPEAQFIGDLLPAAPERVLEPERLLSAIEAHWRFRLWPFQLQGRRPVPGEIAPGFAATITWLVGAYAMAEGKPHASWWVEQQPGHVKLAWQLARVFPQARFIHLVRDGRAVAASLIRCAWGPKRILAAARFWQDRLALGLALETALGPARVLRVAYEDLVEAPEQAMAQVAGHLGLVPDPAMLAPTGLNLPAFTREDHRLVGQPLAPDRLHGWQNELSPRAVELFEAQTGDLLPLLGYPLWFGPHPRPAGAGERVWLTVSDQLLRLVHGRRFARRKQRHLGRRQAVAQTPA